MKSWLCNYRANNRSRLPNTSEYMHSKAESRYRQVRVFHNIDYISKEKDAR